jgi:hypothetical protein
MQQPLPGAAAGALCPSVAILLLTVHIAPTSSIGRWTIGGAPAARKWGNRHVDIGESGTQGFAICARHVSVDGVEELETSGSQVTQKIYIACPSQTGEVGELAEIFQWRGEVAPGLPDFSTADRQHTGEELSDVLLYLVRLADVCGIDLAACV